MAGIRRAIAAVVSLIAALAQTCAVSAAEPQCRFPGPWTRIDEGARTPSGAHLSPLGIAADPSVIRDGDRYRIWFTNADSRGRTGIAQAEGTNGRTWTVRRSPRDPDPIMDLTLAPPSDQWDAPGIETPNVVRTPEGGYRLYYAGNRVPQASITYAIGMAESADGTSWVRHGPPVVEPLNDWEQPTCASPGDPLTCKRGGVLEPSVLYDPAVKLYRMWYVGLGEPPDSFRTYRIGYATSVDGISWTRRPKPVFELGTPGSWDEMWTSHVNVVADPKAGFHMFYFGSAPKDYRDGVEIQKGSIGHAYSPDGIRWQRNPANPILAPRAEKADRWSLGGPSALIEGNRIRLWYFASADSGLRSEILLAEARCGP